MLRKTYTLCFVNILFWLPFAVHAQNFTAPSTKPSSFPSSEKSTQNTPPSNSISPTPVLSQHLPSISPKTISASASAPNSPSNKKTQTIGPASPENTPITNLAPWIVSTDSFWHTGVLLVGLLCITFFVNLINKSQRFRLRKVVFLFGFHVFFQVFSHTLFFWESLLWGERLQALANLFGAFVLVHLLSILVFYLILPFLRIQVASIAVELAVGAGYLFSFLLILASFGLDATGLLTTSAVVTAVIGLSLQKTLGNILGGVALQLDNSISVGDWIQLEKGPQGKVVQIRWRHTVVETRDWDTLIIPNSTLLDSSITILGKRVGTSAPHRMWVYFNVDFRYSPSDVIQAVNEALQSAPISRVASHPPPHCILCDFAKDHHVSMGYYAVRYWLTDLLLNELTSSEVRERIYFALKRVNIPLAIPAQAVFLTKEDKEHDEMHKAREKNHRLESLRSVDIFSSLSPKELEDLAEHLQYCPFGKGERMTQQGMNDHWLYIMTKGKAEVRVQAKGKEETVANISAPTFFGEMALLTGEPRSATVTATTEVECYRLDKKDFELILSNREGILEDISRLLAERRVELEAVRSQSDNALKAKKLQDQAGQILEKIQGFFGLK